MMIITKHLKFFFIFFIFLTMPSIAMGMSAIDVIVSFEPNSAKITQENEEVLDKFIQDVPNLMKGYPGAIFELEGHADGTEKKSEDLSLNRALAVFDYLLSKGMSATTLKLSHFGHTRPIATNQTLEGRAKNRRVEITLPGTGCGTTFKLKDK